MKKLLIVVIIIALAVALVGFMVIRMKANNVNNRVSLIDTAALDKLKVNDGSSISTDRLADGITPPTNKWFSGLALQKNPMTVFASPLGISASDTSLKYGLPVMSASQNSVIGQLAGVATVAVSSADTYKITRYDELSVELTYFKSNEKLAKATITAGSPYIQFISMKDTRLAVSLDGQKNIGLTDASVEATTGQYLAMGFNGATFASSQQGFDISMPAEGYVSLYVLPKGTTNDTLKEFASSQITGAEVTYSNSERSSETTIKINTKDNTPTVYGYLPHQTHSAQGIQSYNTLYGKVSMASGNDFSFTTPILEVTNSLDVASISEEDKKLLTRTLRQEINATKYVAPDTYFSGKELYRSAQLLQLANQLNETEIASSIQLKLRKELDTWLYTDAEQTGKYFYYDNRMQSIVGVQSSFGSEDINDHHFHYGYFIYAASILARYDSTFMDAHKSKVNLLVADIANYNQNEKLPLRRSFDPYFGHSWASGSSPFNDGNNQESTSEALNAWIATSLWADQTNNSALKNQSTWMLSNESASTNAYWMDIDTTKAPFNNTYTRSIVSLNWGGKRDYATFFSAEPNAIFGIQLIPMSPTMVRQLSYEPDTIRKHVSEALPNGSYTTTFSDFILMYSALNGVTNQLEIASQLPDEYIDGVNSRSYMYAWIMSQK